MSEASAIGDAILEWEAAGRRLSIREVSSMDEFHAVEEIQSEAWGFSDLDVVPMGQLVAAKWAGGPLLGAFEGSRMIGFAYGFPAYEDGCVSVHSHMLAVRPDSRNLHAGFLLKLAQRAWVLQHGITEMTWTFDPLQSLNAHLNFSKLGVISERYLVNFYGEATSSPLHQGVGTDRLWVRWMLDSERVRKRIDAEQSRLGPLPGATTPGGDSHTGGEAPERIVREIDRFPPSSVSPLLVQGADGWTRDSSAMADAPLCLIEIPDDISAVKRETPLAAREWRDSVRRSFQAALGSGFVTEEFYHARVRDARIRDARLRDARGYKASGHKASDDGSSRWFYMLSRK